MPVDPALQPLLGGFVAEAEAIASAVGKRLMELERAEGDADARRAAFSEVARGLHTLKGTSGTFGLQDLAELAHCMEDMLEALRRSRRTVDGAAADTLLRGLDVLLSRLRAHADGRGDSLPDLWDTLALLRDASPAGQRQDPALPADVDAPAEGDAGSWRVAASDVAGLIEEVERLRELRLRLERRIADLGGALEIAGGAASSDLRALLFDLRRGLTSDREEATDVVVALEDAVKAICTLPVRTVLDPLHRAVRDLCRQTGKRARLSIVGGDVSLDRRLLEALRGPLVHLVRNSLDHGVELPVERERRGKHGEGAIVVRVDQRGNILVLEVSDDGAGIDPAHVRRAAIARGVATAEELGRMTAGEVVRLVFRPGLSTRAGVTETSGRGVGLDVVQAQIHALQGHVDVETVLGQGTRFMMSVPSEIGSSAALVVRVGEQTLALPMHAVQSVVAAKAGKLRTAHARTTVEHHGEALAVEDLGALLGLRQARVPVDGAPLLVVEGGGRTAAIAVDEILRDMDVVIRPLSYELRALSAYQGAATAASGELLLVLRPEWLVGHDPLREPSEVRRALVVDDSLTARALHRTVLEAAGFAVHTASSAEQALEQASHTRYDVTVADVAMEGMDGIELCAALRSRPETRDMPVILVSAREEEEVRRRALASGAAGFLTKRDCASGRLIAEVSAVLGKRGSEPWASGASRRPEGADT